MIGPNLFAQLNNFVLKLVALQKCKRTTSILDTSNFPFALSTPLGGGQGGEERDVGLAGGAPTAVAAEEASDAVCGFPDDCCTCSHTVSALLSTFESSPILFIITNLKNQLLKIVLPVFSTGPSTGASDTVASFTSPKLGYICNKIR